MTTEPMAAGPDGGTASGALAVHLVHQGFGDYVAGLLGGLDSIGSDRLRVTATRITSGPALLSGTESSDADHRTVAVPRFRDPRSGWRARREVARIVERPCDVVHWQAAGNPLVDLAFLRWLERSGRTAAARPAVVLTVHDMQAHPGDRSVLPGTFAVIRRLIGRADRIIVHAGHIADQAVAAGAERSRVVVMPHGELGTRYLAADRLPLEPPVEPNVLFFGRAQGYKGLDLAAEAMPAVVDAVPDARLVVAGSGPSIEEVFPADRPLPPWAELHRGLVPAEQVPELFGRATVVVLPYREASQSGVAALAAGLGRGVVATRVPGLADIVADGHSGVLVDPGSAPALAEALIDVLRQPERARALAAGAHRHATSTLAWPSIANDLVDLYHETVSSGNRVAGSGRRRFPRRAPRTPRRVR